MKRYEKYKPSGVEWIGEIPEHWESIKLKYIAKINPPKPSFQFDNSSDSKVVFLPMERVSESGKINQEIRKSISEVSSGFTCFAKSDVIVAKITPCFENGKGALLDDLETDFGYGSTEFHVLRANESVSPEFLFYITKTYPFIKTGEAFMTGSAGQKRVPSSFVENFLLGFPSPTEQIAITNYLDDKTVQIDNFIDNKQKLIELLKEERTAIINHAVTKGINPKAKLKPSGVDWLGDIPEHWEVKRLKYVVSKVGSGITPTGGASVYQNEGIPLLRSQNIHNDGLKLDDVAYISEDVDEQMSNSRIEEDDILLNITGASIGRCFYVPKGFGKGNVNQHVCIIRPIQDLLRTKFLHSIIISGYGQALIDTCQTGANREGLNFQQIKAFDLPMPDIKEQEQIVDFIDAHSTRINATISKIEKEIELLQEYHTALISEVVTGKIKVS